MPITIKTARAHARALASFVLSGTALKAFGETGEVKPGLAQEVRLLEKSKSSLKDEGRINSASYWSIVDLEAFINHHLDGGLADLRAAYADSLKAV